MTCIMICIMRIRNSCYANLMGFLNVKATILVIIFFVLVQFQFATSKTKLDI